jgi:serine/threonine protein kinase
VDGDERAGLHNAGAPFGRYRLLEVLGRGGMGEVWRAYDTETNRVVALKVLAPEFAHDEVYKERFRREAYAAAGLSEPHVVPIHAFGEIDGRLYVDMRLVDSQDLLAMIGEGPLAPMRAAWIVEQVAAALEAAHRIGLVHRDVKPSNILVTEDDFAYLIDFGIARTVSDTSLTGTGNAIGSWAYMAPERISEGVVDPRSDVYALACVLHECLTGSRPYPGDSFEQLAAQHIWTPPPRPSALRADLPGHFDDVIAQGMAKDPQERYQTARSFAKAAREALTDPTPRPRPQQPAPPPAAATHLLPPRPETGPPTSVPPAPAAPPSVPPAAATDVTPAEAPRAGLPKWAPYAIGATAVVLIGLVVTVALTLFRTPSSTPTAAAPASTSAAPGSSAPLKTAVSETSSAAAPSTAPPPAPAPPAPPPGTPQGTGEAVVKDAVDIYDIPDGVGNIIGVLHPGRRVSLVEPCRDGWCHVVLPEMPGGTGWVWGEFLGF